MQILTGLSTLEVPDFSTGQLIFERIVLNQTFEAAEIELSLSSNAILKDINTLTMTCEPIRKESLQQDRVFRNPYRGPEVCPREYYGFLPVE